MDKTHVKRAWFPFDQDAFEQQLKDSTFVQRFGFQVGGTTFEPDRAPAEQEDAARVNGSSFKCGQDLNLVAGYVVSVGYVHMAFAKVGTIILRRDYDFKDYPSAVNALAQFCSDTLRQAINGWVAYNIAQL